MHDEMDRLLTRARELEEHNEILTSMQSPGGDDADLRSENALLRHELEQVRRQSGSAEPLKDSNAVAVESVEDFLAMGAEDRIRAAGAMTQAERDHLLGRRGRPAESQSYL